MTNAEATFQSAVRNLGCVVCLKTMNVHSPCEIHHILSGGRRIGEMDVLGLCFRHHRSDQNNSVWVSRHRWRLVFEGRYGTEAELLAWTRKRVEEAQRVAA